MRAWPTESRYGRILHNRHYAYYDRKRRRRGRPSAYPGRSLFSRLLAWLKKSSLTWLLMGSLAGSPVWAVQVDPWTRADTWREIAWHTVNLIDWGQTLDIADDCDTGGDHREMNPMLDRCPGRGEVNHYFFLSAVIHGMVAYQLPVKYRSTFQYVTLGISSALTLHNYNIGLKIKF